MAIAAKVIPMALSRLRRGEKVWHVADELSLPRQVLNRIANEQGVKLKKGPAPVQFDSGGTAEAYCRHFDRKHGVGTAESYLRFYKSHTQERTGIVWGRKLTGKPQSRQWAHQIGRNITGDAPKQVIREVEPLGRPDVTPDKIARPAEQGKHRAEIARLLHASETLISNRARQFGITIPRFKGQPRRKDVTTAMVRRAARECDSILAMARRLKIAHTAILWRAQKYGIPLPNGRQAAVSRRRAVVRIIRNLDREGRSDREIAAIVGRAPHTISEYRSRFLKGGRNGRSEGSRKSF